MKRFVFMLSVMLMACISLFAQDAITLVDVAEAPDYSSNFATFAALVAVVPFVVEAFKKLLPNASHGVQVAISWIVGIVVTMFGWLFGLCASYHTYCQSVVGEHGQEESLCKSALQSFSAFHYYVLSFRFQWLSLWNGEYNRGRIVYCLLFE